MTLAQAPFTPGEIGGGQAHDEPSRHGSDERRTFELHARNAVGPRPEVERDGDVGGASGLPETVWTVGARGAVCHATVLAEVQLGVEQTVTAGVSGPTRPTNGFEFPDD